MSSAYELDFLISFLPYVVNKQIAINERNNLSCKTDFDIVCNFEFHSLFNSVMKYLDAKDYFKIFVVRMIHKINENQLYLSNLNIHRIFIVCLIVSLKYLEDDLSRFDDLLTVVELEKEKYFYLENEILNILDFKLCLSDKEYAESCVQLYEFI